MKFLKVILPLIVIFVIGYFLGNIFPWSGVSFSGGGKDIVGSARLEVILQMDNGQPVGNIEVDLAEKPGPPQKGGAVIADENGLAVFNVKPGNYFIYFNSGSFPKNLQEPKPQPIQLNEESTSKKTITLKTKEN